MALEAEGAHVGEVAFPAALGDGDDVIGVPEGFTASEAPYGCGFEAGCATEAAKMRVFGDAIGAAHGTDAFIAFEDAFPEVARVAAETPFFDAKSRTKCLAPGRHLQFTPTA